MEKKNDLFARGGAGGDTKAVTAPKTEVSRVTKSERK
jgi:hypothetical protein